MRPLLLFLPVGMRRFPTLLSINLWKEIVDIDGSEEIAI